MSFATPKDVIYPYIFLFFQLFSAGTEMPSEPASKEVNIETSLDQNSMVFRQG